MSQQTQCFQFGEFVLDVAEGVLLRRGNPVHVPSKVLSLLTILVENHGHIVEKQTLMEKVWKDSFVEDGSLTFTMRQLRKILGDDRRSPLFVETVPKRGYRFIANVAECVQRDGRVEPEPFSIQDWSRRPVFVSVVVIVALAALVSGGFFVWRGGKDTAASTSDALTLKFETLMSSRQPFSATISPDGNYIAYTATANGEKSLWIKQVATGVNTEIVSPVEGVDYFHLEFSSDGQYVYFTRRFRDELVRLDRVSIFGGVVKENVLNELDGSFSLSRDGRHISFRRYAPDRRSLCVADVDGTAEREIFTTEKTLTGNAISPDGRMIAFASGQSDTGERDFGVYTIDIDGNTVHEATDFTWLHVRDVVWLPDQSGLLVTARVGNEPQQVWKIELSTGEVKQVTDTPSGSLAISATNDFSRILLTQASRSATVYVASPSEPEAVQPVTEAWEKAVWAPQQNLVYDSLVGGNDDIWVLSADKRLRTQLTTEGSTDFDPQISPDGRYIVFTSDRAGKYNVWRMAADGSTPTRLTDGGGEQSPVFTPDGKYVVFSSMKDSTLWRVPLEGGVALPIANIPGDEIAISHDGTKFARFAEKDGGAVIIIGSFPDGKVLDEFRLPEGYFAGADIRWTSDGESIVYIAGDTGPVDNLWQQPIAGGPPRQITNYNAEEIYSFDFSPDNSQIAITRGYWSHDTVLVRGFKYN